MVVGGYMTKREQNAWERRQNREGGYPDAEHARNQQKGGDYDPKSKTFKGEASIVYTNGDGGKVPNVVLVPELINVKLSPSVKPDPNVPFNHKACIFLLAGI